MGYRDPTNGYNTQTYRGGVISGGPVTLIASGAAGSRGAAIDFAMLRFTNTGATGAGSTGKIEVGGKRVMEAGTSLASSNANVSIKPDDTVVITTTNEVPFLANALLYTITVRYL